MQWVPKEQYFKPQMKYKVWTNKYKLRKPKEKLAWTFNFDGSKCKLGVGVGIELVNPKFFYHAYCLQFMCTKSVTKYEALIHELLFTLGKDVKALIIDGDSQLAYRKRV